MKESSSVSREKTHIYEFFANIFAKEPTLALLRLCQAKENDKLFRSCGIDPFSDIKHLSRDEQKELLAVEYARLFLAPARLAAPYESLQQGEGRLWGKSTVEVNEIYKKFGFELDDSFKNTPDHLSAELAFLAQLSALELEYENGGLVEAKNGVLEVKKYFFKNHLLVWFPYFKNEVVKHAKFCYYRNIIQLLDIFLNEEWEGLRDILDIS